MLCVACYLQQYTTISSVKLKHNHTAAEDPSGITYVHQSQQNITQEHEKREMCREVEKCVDDALEKTSIFQESRLHDFLVVACDETILGK